MNYEDEFFLVGESRRRQPNREVALECACNVLGDNNHNHECGCGKQDPDRTEKHVYHHIVEDRPTCGKPKPENNCNNKGCACQQLKRLSMNTDVSVYLEGADAPIAGLSFISYDPHTGCATFTAATGTLVIDCKKIAALLYV